MLALIASIVCNMGVAKDETWSGASDPRARPADLRFTLPDILLYTRQAARLLHGWRLAGTGKGGQPRWSTRPPAQRGTARLARALVGDGRIYDGGAGASSTPLPSDDGGPGRGGGAVKGVDTHNGGAGASGTPYPATREVLGTAAG